MAEIRVTAEAAIAAPPEQVYSYIADFREHHHRFLPPAFSDYHVEQGGIGAGTIISFKVTARGRSRAYRSLVAEPIPGRVLTESDTLSGSVTTFTVTPAGAGSRVRIETVWQARGVTGLVERLAAPRFLKKLYADELARLDRYARDRAG